MICLDELLYGEPTWEQVVEFFRNGEFCEEQYLVEAIKRHLRTELDRRELFDMDASIEDILNGRTTRTPPSYLRPMEYQARISTFRLLTSA